MGHPAIVNQTRFAFEPVFIADEELRPVVVLVIKATFAFDDGGAVRLAEEQVPVNLVGEPVSDAPVSSYRYEPEIALHKPATDVVLIGHALPPGGGATHVDVGLKVGPVRKLARVFGDRFWVWTKQGAVRSRTGPLRPIPLTWEHAFGGRDEPSSSPDRAAIEARNPVGTGFGMPMRHDGDHLRLPNIEDPQQLIDAYGAVVPPCGFGFTSPDWQPRAGFAGTYDERWERTRKPLLPLDFDRRFFNAAPPGLVAPGYLRGNEDVVVLNVGQVPRLVLRLPAVPPPRCRVVLRREIDRDVAVNLDTVIVNLDEQRLLLIWRGHAPVGGGPHDVSDIMVGPPQ